MRVIVAPETLKNGVEGTEQLVERITNEIRAGAARDEVRELARSIARNTRPQDSTGEIRAVWDWLTAIDAPPYRQDPLGKQLFTKPESFRALSGVDCKKYAITGGALLEALGHPVKVRVIDQRRQNPLGEAAYHHVYVQVFNKDTGRWEAFDPVARSFRDPSAGVGAELNHKARRTYMIRPATPIRNGLIVGQPQPVGFSLYETFIKPFDFTRDDNKGSAAAAFAKGFLPDIAVAAAEGHAAAVKDQAPKPAPVVVSLTKTAAPAPNVTSALKKAVDSSRAKLATTTAKSTSAPLTNAPKAEMSTGTKVAIGVAGAAAAAALVYALTRRKPRRSNPRRRKSRRAA